MASLEEYGYLCIAAVRTPETPDIAISITKKHDSCFRIDVSCCWSFTIHVADFVVATTQDIQMALAAPTLHSIAFRFCESETCVSVINGKVVTGDVNVTDNLVLWFVEKSSVAIYSQHSAVTKQQHCAVLFKEVLNLIESADTYLGVSCRLNTGRIRESSTSMLQKLQSNFGSIREITTESFIRVSPNSDTAIAFDAETGLCITTTMISKYTNTFEQEVSGGFLRLDKLEELDSLFTTTPGGQCCDGLCHWIYKKAHGATTTTIRGDFCTARIRNSRLAESRTVVPRRALYCAKHAAIRTRDSAPLVKRIRRTSVSQSILCVVPDSCYNVYRDYFVRRDTDVLFYKKFIDTAVDDYIATEFPVDCVVVRYSDIETLSGILPPNAFRTVLVDVSTGTSDIPDSVSDILNSNTLALHLFVSLSAITDTIVSGLLYYKATLVKAYDCRLMVPWESLSEYIWISPKIQKVTARMETRIIPNILNTTPRLDSQSRDSRASTLELDDGPLRFGFRVALERPTKVITDTLRRKNECANTKFLSGVISEITNDPNDWSCGICLEVSSGGLQRVTTICGHTYCLNCIIQYVSTVSKVTCPTCKRRLGVTSMFAFQQELVSLDESVSDIAVCVESMRFAQILKMVHDNAFKHRVTVVSESDLCVRNALYFVGRYSLNRYIQVARVQRICGRLDLTGFSGGTLITPDAVSNDECIFNEFPDGLVFYRFEMLK